MTAKKFDEVQSQLDDLKQDHPDPKPAGAPAEVLEQKRPEAPSLQRAQTRVAVPPEKRSAAQPSPASEYARSMELAEELRRSLQKLRSSAAPRRIAAAPSSMASGPRPVKPQPDPAEPSGASSSPSSPSVGEGSDVTLVRGVPPPKPALPAAPPTQAKPSEPNATVASTPRRSPSATEKKDASAESPTPGTKPIEG